MPAFLQFDFRTLMSADSDHRTIPNKSAAPNGQTPYFSACESRLTIILHLPDGQNQVRSERTADEAAGERITPQTRVPLRFSLGAGLTMHEALGGSDRA